jgi:hypothetical protein
VTAPIVIRRYFAEGTRKHGYRWTCRLCGQSGTHRFDRFTDWVLADYGKRDVHPQQRCIEGAERHLKRRHGTPPATVHVHLHIGGAT